jgi:imidazolonepropionase-like amidohydrolase
VYNDGVAVFPKTHRCVLLLIIASLTGCGAPQPRSNGTAITNVRVFDGLQRLPNELTIIIEDGAITQVGSEIDVSRFTNIVDGRGKVAIPGLFDAHMHAGDGVLVMAQQVAFGVTSSVGMYDDLEVARKLRADTDHGSGFKSAALGATLPGGHGTEYGGVVPTLSQPDEADSFVAKRVSEGSDFLKIILGPPRMPMLSERTVEALVAAAHKRGLLAVAHVDRLSEAKAAVRAGVDGLAHIFCDEITDEEFVKDLVTRNVFVIPTLTIRQRANLGNEWQANGDVLLRNHAVTAYLPDAIRKELAVPRVGNDLWRVIASQNAAQLHRGGVTILAGSDAPNPGTTWGASLHHELQLLVDAGLSTEGALAAATSRPAARFGFHDRGRIAPRMRADVLLLECDPVEAIECTTRIAAVWHGGSRIDRKVVNPSATGNQ